MRTLFMIIPLFVVVFLAGWFSHAFFKTRSVDSSNVLPQSIENIVKPFEKYSIENMKNVTFKDGKFKKGKELGDEEEYLSYLFSFEFDPELEGKDTKSITGQMNIPKEDGTFPLVVMFRGFVDQTLYTTGTGTRPAAAYFAKNGFVTMAPDFLGYADSDSESGNIFETRFQTYTTAASLLKSLRTDSLDTVLGGKWDKKNIFIWAHSNGGQIALTSLEITGVTYPTTLWAPVTKPFPYSILYYTDESQDGGKFIRKELAEFERSYDTDNYSLTKYLDLIQAPIQIQQGTGDTAVPVIWSGEFTAKMRNLDKEITYYTYPGADHNLRPDWDTVVEKDVEFFRKYIQ
jgi:alpha-beta hydrolase superfamily lysophospholipase